MTAASAAVDKMTKKIEPEIFRLLQSIKKSQFNLRIKLFRFWLIPRWSAVVFVFGIRSSSSSGTSRHWTLSTLPTNFSACSGFCSFASPSHRFSFHYVGVACFYHLLLWKLFSWCSSSVFTSSSSTFLQLSMQTTIKSSEKTSEWLEWVFPCPLCIFIPIPICPPVVIFEPPRRNCF